MLTPDLQQLTDVRPQLEQSLMAQAWTVAGDVLWAIERRNFDDLASSWRRLCRLRGVDFSAEPLPAIGVNQYWRERESDVWDGLQKAISAALRNAEALDWHRHWDSAHRAVQTALVAETQYYGKIGKVAGHVHPDFSYGRARLAAHYARLALGGGQ